MANSEKNFKEEQHQISPTVSQTLKTVSSWSNPRWFLLQDEMPGWLNGSCDPGQKFVTDQVAEIDFSDFLNCQFVVLSELCLRHWEGEEANVESDYTD